MREIFVLGFMDLTTDDIVRLVIAFVLLGVSILLFRRGRSIVTSFLLVGSAAYLAKHLFWDFLGFLAPYMLLHPDSSFGRLFYPTDANAPWTNHVALALLFLSGLFPIGVLLYVITALRKHLTNRSSQPLTGA